MGRFILGVLLAVAVVWGYGRLFGNAAEAGIGSGGGGSQFVDPGASDVPAEAPPVAADTGGEGLSIPMGGTGPTAEPPTFRALLSTTGARRDAVAVALHRAVRDAESVTAMLSALGSDNAFLHSVEGRAAAQQVVDRLSSGEPWEAVRASSRLLELAAKGPIERGQTDARVTLDRVRSSHDALVRRTVFDPADLTGARRHQVKEGESLTTIARALGRTLNLPLQPGTLQLVNRIDNPNVIRLGQVLKVPVDAVRTVIWKSSFLVTVYVGDVIVRTYICAHGKLGHETPETVFTVGPTTENPDWHYGGEVIAFGDPRNPLGTHFVQFQHESYSGFGAHGTNEPDSVGTQASLGCIRLGAHEVIEFAQFVPRGSKVEIRP